MSQQVEAVAYFPVAESLVAGFWRALLEVDSRETYLFADIDHTFVAVQDSCFEEVERRMILVVLDVAAYPTSIEGALDPFPVCLIAVPRNFACLRCIVFAAQVSSWRADNLLHPEILYIAQDYFYRLPHTLREFCNHQGLLHFYNLQSPQVRTGVSRSWWRCSD